jgi:hypothetical protein
MTNALPQTANDFQERTLCGTEYLQSIKSASPQEKGIARAKAPKVPKIVELNDLYQDEAPRERCLVHQSALSKTMGV